MDESKIRQIEMVIEESVKKLESGILPLEEDYFFHESIALASRNYLLYRIWKPVFDYGKTILKESLGRNGRPEVSIQEHQNILKALKARNVEEAVIQMRLHLEKSEFFA